MTRTTPVTAIKRFKSFHGHAPTRLQSIPFHTPKTLIHLGRAVAIIYECDKVNGGGDGTLARYRHDFSTDAHLFMDETGKNQLYICGDRLVITSAGIKN